MIILKKVRLHGHSDPKMVCNTCIHTPNLKFLPQRQFNIGIRLSVNSILFKYKYIMIQTIYIHKTLHLKGIQKQVPDLFKSVS